MTDALGIPDRYYKRRPFPPRIPVLVDKTYKTDIGRERATATRVRKLMWEQVAQSLVDQIKAAQTAVFTAGAQHYGFYDSQEPVAIITDGIPGKPVSEMKVGGHVVYAKHDAKAVRDAALEAYNLLLRGSPIGSERFKRTPGKPRRYHKSHEIRVNGIPIDPGLLKSYPLEKIDSIVIVNANAYSRKIEDDFGYGVYRNVWKKMRSAGWMRRVAMSYRYLEGPFTAYPGRSVVHPALIIQPLGTAVSRSRKI